MIQDIFFRQSLSRLLANHLVDFNEALGKGTAVSIGDASEEQLRKQATLYVEERLPNTDAEPSQDSINHLLRDFNFDGTTESKITRSLKQYKGESFKPAISQLLFELLIDFRKGYNARTVRPSIEEAAEKYVETNLSSVQKTLSFLIDETSAPEEIQIHLMDMLSDFVTSSTRESLKSALKSPEKAPTPTSS